MREDKLIPAIAAGEVPKSRSLAGAFGAFVVYQALSILFYGRGMIFRLAEVHAGNRRDPQIFIWCFQWWPHAIAQRLDAFHPRIIWAPEGVDLAWVTSIPLPSLIAAPLTARYGAVASYNLAILLMPALAALTAFILVRRIADSTWPAMLGGYLFGFSPYMIGHQAAGHLELTAVFLAPVVVSLALLRLDEKIARPWFVIALATALTCQFLISLEIFATIVMFGAVALIVAWLTIPALSTRIRDLAILSAIALAASIVVLTPYLYRVVVASGLSSHPLWNTTPFGTDLLEIFIPTSTLMLGHLPPLPADLEPLLAQRDRERRIPGPAAGHHCGVVPQIAMEAARGALCGDHARDALCRIVWRAASRCGLHVVRDAVEAADARAAHQQRLSGSLHDVYLSDRRPDRVALDRGTSRERRRKSRDRRRGSVVHASQSEGRAICA